MSDKDRKWFQQCDIMLEYHRQMGSCNVPTRMKCVLSDGTVVPIGMWLFNQRKMKRNGMMRSDRCDILQKLVSEGKLLWFMDNHASLGEFTTDDDKWNSMYSALVRYGESNNGDCNVPHRYITTLEDGEDVRLGLWLTNQRTLKTNRDNKKDVLIRKDRMQRLQQLVDEGKLQWRMR